MKPIITFAKFVSIFLLLFVVSPVMATHISGGEISYKHISAANYEITIDVYYNCDRIGIIGPPTATAVNNDTRIFSSCGTSLTRGFVSKGFVEVSQLCAASLSSSSCGTGSLPGLRKYTFVDTVSLAPRCSSWTIRYNSVNRDASSNVFQATNRSLYIDCILDNVVDSFNSSPIFNADPTPYFCGGTASTYNFNVTDPDGDSISLSLVPGRALVGTSVVSLQYTGTPNAPHNTNFSGANPLPNMSFASGTGSITFNPPTPPAFPANSSYSYVVVLEVKDYDASGNVKSTTRRDMKFEVIRCTGNSIPVPMLGGVHSVSGGARIDSNTVRVIEGDSITFSFSFVDIGDSITLSSIVNQTLGATFTSSTAIDTATGVIGWRPSTVTGSPFSFSIDALDDNCPVSGRNSATLKIQVIDTLEAINYTEQKQSCNNIADGQLTVNHVGGIGPFGYRWFKNGVLAPSLTTQTITGISSGDSYSVTVVDSFNNTTSSLGSTNIAQTNPISIATDSVTDIGCNFGCNGEINISSVIGGNPTQAGPTGYIYTWSGISDTTNNPKNLCAGRYFVTVSDQNACDTVYRFYVNGPADFTAFISDSVDVLCKGDSTGEATVSIDITSCGITDDLCDSLSIDTVGTGTATNTFNGWPAPYGGRRNAKQQYLLRASEINSAGIPGDIKISSLAFLIQQDNFIVDVDNFEINMGCTSLDSLPPDTFITGLFNVFDSSFISIPTGVFTPTWKQHQFQNAFVWDGSSNIVVEVNWNNGSSASLVNSIHRLTNTSYRSSTFFVSNSGNASLADSITGSANRRPNMRFGFCGPEMTYSWSSGGTDSTETGLWAATHTVTVTNEESCSDTVSVQINEPALAMVASLASKVDVNCAGDSSGLARITVSGGTAPYTFTWPAGVSTGANDSIGINLTSGIRYVVTVTDVNSCEDTAAFEINDLSRVTVAITDSVSILCFGDANGRLFATPDSGLSPYSFAWQRIPSGAVTTGATDSIAINLSSGTYRVVVTDSVGCTDSIDVRLSDPPALSSSFTDSTLIGCNGDTTASLTITPQGGTPNYSFSWFRLNGTVSTGTSDSIAINLPADTVGVIIQDANGCRDTNARIISEPSLLTASFTDSNAVSCVGGTNGSLTITPNGGTPGYNFAWSPAVTVGVSDSIATGLSANVLYIVTVTDANLCSVVDSFRLRVPTNGVQVAITDSVAISCNGGANGQLFATPSNGTPNYSYTWIKLGGGTVSTGATDSIAINLSADTYRVIVTDNNACQDSVDYTLSEPTVVNASFVDSVTLACFGDSNGSLTVLPSGGTPGYTFTWSPAVTTGASDSIALNLSAGINYRVIVADANACADTIFRQLSQPTDLSSSFTDSSSVSCSGVADGSVTVTPTGGTPGYTYTWSPAVTTGASDSIATLLSGNITYTVIIQDANSCRDTNSIRLNDPAGVTSSFTDSTSLSCPGDTNGSLTITPNGGNAPYTYTWSASNGSTVSTGASDSIAINLSSGVTYSVIVRDANNCTDTNSRVLAAPVGGLSLTITDSTAISCFGDANGSLTVTPSGGTPGYTFVWTNLGGGAVSTGASDSIAISLSSDTFRVVVSDNNGCSDSLDYFLVEPTELTSSFTDSSAVSCFGANDGSLTITPSGGTPGYTYNWVRLGGLVNTGATDSIAINLPHDTVGVVIIDANNCRDTNARIVSQPAELSSSFTDSVSVTCAALGSATVTPNGGTPGYTFSWSPAVTTGASDSIATGLNGATAYRVVISDANNCLDTNFITLQDPVRPVAQFTDSTGVSCPGDTNASLTVTPTGGLAPFTFTWTPSVSTGASDSIAINLTSSVLYTVVVSDSLGCSDTVSRTISAPSAVQASIFDSSSVSCAADTNGRLFGRASLGASPYSYSWLRVGSVLPVDTGVADSIAIRLGAGTYRLIVTDNNGCLDSTEKILVDPDTLTASFTDRTLLACGGSSTAGSLTVTPSGGTPNYTFTWTPAVTTGASDSIAINLSASTLYSVLVTDNNGCTVSISDTLPNPNNFAASFTSISQPICNGDTNGQLIVTPNGGTQPITYTWSSGNPGASDSIRTNLSGGTAIFVTVSDASGCADTVNITLTNPLALASAFTDSSAVSCGGDSTGSLTITPLNGSQPYSFTWTTGVGTGSSDSIAINLAGNFTYSVTVSDGLGCRDTNTFSLNDPPVYTLSFSDSSSVLCNGDLNGSLTVTPSPGGVYTYTWSASNGATVNTGASDSIAVALRGGVIYTVTVQDAFGCQKQISQALSEPSALSLTSSSTPARCGQSQGTATVNPLGGTPGYSFVWDSAGVAIGQTSQTATGLFAGLYNVVVTDTNGCVATASNINVNDFGAPAINLDSIFNASCDGVCNGEIFVSLRSFNGPINTILWSNGDTTADISGLCDTVYTLQVVDSAGCQSFFTDTINNAGSLNLSFTSTPVSCLLTVCDAEIKVTPSGGTNPYSYIWTTGDTIDSIVGLCAGAQTVTVTDLNGCQAIGSDTILNPVPIVATSTSDSVSCNALSDGVARVNVTAGNAPFSYAWSTSVNDTLDSISGLSAGSYFVTISSADGCQIFDTVVVAQPDSINATFTTVPADCGIANGRVTATPSGGNGSYSYLWPVGGSTLNATDTAYLAGSYNVTIRDQKSCAVTLPFTISNVGGPIVSLDSIRNESCVASCDGGIFVSVSAGNPNYLYQWSPGLASTQDLDSVCSGIYTLRVTDQLGCITFFSDTIDAASPIVVNASLVSNASAVGICDGQATTAAIGGTPPYSYLWTGGSTSLNATNLCAGTNYVTVTDSLGCSAIDSIVITEPSTIVLDSFNVTSPSCNVVPCNGAVFVQASGGIGTLTYIWDNGDNGQTTSLRCPGLATVTITDGTDTLIQSYPLSNIGGPIVSTGKQDVLCNGDSTGFAFASSTSGPVSYLWPINGSTNDTLLNLPFGNYEVRVTDTAGCVTTDTIVVNDPPVITASFTQTLPNCLASNGQIIAAINGGTPGYNYLWLDTALNPLSPVQNTDTANNLSAGIYNLRVTDANNCVRIFNVTLGNLGGPVIVLDSLVDVSCNALCDGGIYLSITGTGLNYLWNSGDITEDITNKCAGPYQMGVVDNNFCVSFFTDTIEEPNALVLAHTVQNNASAASLCDGRAFVQASGGNPGYTITWPAGVTSIGAANDSAIALCAGSYVVTLTDANNCSVTDTVTITEPLPITIDSSRFTNPDCGVSPCNGSAEVFASGGAGVLTYFWNNGSVGQLNTGLCPGFYSVSITDGIDTVVQSFVLNNPSGPNISMSKVDVSCNAGSNGIAIVSSSTLGVSFLWPAIPSTNDSITGLSAGTYEARVIDAIGCISVDTISIGEPAALSASTTVLNPNCGATDGEIRAIVNGGTPLYSLVWLDNALNLLTPPQTADTARNLAAGVYNLAIEDGNGCRDTLFNIGLNNLNAAAITFDSLNHESCPSACDADIFVSTSGGTGSLVYSWTGGGTSEDLTNVCPGIYTLTVTDALNCASFYTDTLEAAIPISSVMTLNNAPSAVAICDGSASVSASGGSGTYTYLWTGGQTGSSANNLCVGTNYVTITDGNGCAVIDSIVMPNPAVLRLDTAIVTNPACNVCDGQIVVVMSGGTPPYTYTWDNGDSGDTSSNRCAGIVRLNVRDAAGLSANFSFPLSNFPAPAISLTGDSVSCFGSCDGRAVVNILSALPPFSINWVGLGRNTDTVSNLCAGVYGVEVTDVVGCVAADTIEVKSPAEIVARFTLTEPTCQASDGAINTQIVTIGGKTPYNFEWLDASQNPLIPAQINPNISNLAAGIYYLSITDADNCTKIQNVNLSNQGAPSIILDTLDNETCLGSCDGAIAISSFGAGPLLYDWNLGAFSTEDISGLCPGNYIVQVSDANNCLAFDAYTINPADSFTLSLRSITDASCVESNDGAIDVDVFGASAPFVYSWTGPANFNAGVQDVSGLIAGAYTLKVEDVNACEDSLKFTIGVATQLEVRAPDDTSICGNPGSIFLRAVATSNASVSFTWYDDLGFVEGNSDLIRLIPQTGNTQYVVEAKAGLCLAYDTITVNFESFVRADAGEDLVITKGDEVVIGGNPTALAGEIVSWTPDNYFVGTPDEYNPRVKPDESIEYIVEVTSAFGCVARDTMRVTVNPLKLVDGFTPNNDGVNDLWRLKYLDDFPNALVEVYNRWGQLVFRSNGYSTPWDGKYKGQDLPVGTYYYVIDLNDDSAEERVLTGPVTIMR